MPTPGKCLREVPPNVPVQMKVWAWANTVNGREQSVVQQWSLYLDRGKEKEILKRS